MQRETGGPTALRGAGGAEPGDRPHLPSDRPHLRGGGDPARLPGDRPRLSQDPRAVATLHLPAREGRTASWPTWLDARVREAYVARGIIEPWRHQVSTAELAWAGTHVLVATGTASGKSAAFGMPALTAALADPAGGTGGGAAVLYVSPTKALAHDQLASLHGLELRGLRAAAVDGDAPDEQRRWAQAHARWVVTNPDMLHRGLLPRHDRWRRLLRSLRFVVVDEAHVYRGVFGSHVALVLRRLRRLAEQHGSSPTFLLASGTVADPAATAERLLGLPVVVVDADDSRRAPVDLVLWNPQPPDPSPRGSPGESASVTGSPPAPGTRGVDLPDESVADGHSATAGGTPRSCLAETADLMARLVDSGTRTLAFARSRRGVETISSTVRRSAANGGRVRAYRGGYLPEERRALESDLRQGRLLGLAATNALELGIDVSGLDAVLLAGWPGTHSSFWQQVGRAGRRGARALAVLVAREDPLDQYLVRHPEVITGRAVEATALDPANPYVLAGHLCAAAAESPLRRHEVDAAFGPGAAEMCQVLTDRGLLRARRDGWYWTSASRAADLVDLRGAAGGPVRVVEAATGSLLGTVDPAMAPAVVHQGAIYVHQGATYLVEELDVGARVATVSGAPTDLSTHARSTTDVELEDRRLVTHWGPVELVHGGVRLSSRVTSYLVRRWPSGQVIAEHPLDLPAMTLHTAAVWWSIPDSLLRAADITEAAVPGAVHALEHAAIGMLPLFVACDRWDIGGISSAHHHQTGAALIVVHDGQAGGAGFAERGFHRAAGWLAATHETIATCACSSGCPSCVQSPKCGNGNQPLDKRAALRLASALLDALAVTPHLP